MSYEVPSNLLFEKPLVPTPSSRMSPPITSPKYLKDLHLPPLFPDEFWWRPKRESPLKVLRGVAFFEATEHCIGATKTIQRPHAKHREALKKIESLIEKSGNEEISRESLIEVRNSIRRLAVNRSQILRFRRPIHREPIFQRVAGTISKDGSAKLLVARYHDQCLTPAKFTLLCDKELFGKKCKLGEDFPKNIQYRVFDLDDPDVRGALEKHLFCDNSRHSHHVKAFEPFFWTKEKRASDIGSQIKKK